MAPRKDIAKATEAIRIKSSLGFKVPKKINEGIKKNWITNNQDFLWPKNLEKNTILYLSKNGDQRNLILQGMDVKANNPIVEISILSLVNHIKRVDKIR